MTVTTTISSKDFVTNGVTTVFPFSIQFFRDTDLQVTKIDPSGAETLLTLGIHYTVQGAGSPNGGSITTLGTPLPAGTLLVERVLVAQQQTDLRNQGSNFAENHERVFDRLTMLIQQVMTGLGNALQLTKDKLRWDFKGKRGINVGSPVDATDTATKGYTDSLNVKTVRAPDSLAELPAAASRASQLMGFNENGAPIVFPPGAGSANELAIALANASDPAKGAGIVGRAIRNINSISELQGVSGKYAGETVRVISYYDGWAIYAVPRNLGGGLFVWDASSVATQDLGSVVEATGVATGRWIRQFDADPDAYQWGARGDESADDIDPIQRLVNYVASAGGGVARLLGGSYTVGSTLVHLSGVRLIGAGATQTTLKPTAAFRAAMQDAGGPGYNLVANYGFNVDGQPEYGSAFDLSIEHIRFVFDTTAAVGVSSHKNNCIFWNNSRRLSLANCTFYGWGQHAVDISGCRDVVVEWNSCFNGFWSAIQIDQAGGGYGASTTRSQRSLNVVVKNNYLEGYQSTYGAIQIHKDGGSGVDIDGNYLVNCRAGICTDDFFAESFSPIGKSSRIRIRNNSVISNVALSIGIRIAKELSEVEVSSNVVSVLGEALRTGGGAAGTWQTDVIIKGNYLSGSTSRLVGMRRARVKDNHFVCASSKIRVALDNFWIHNNAIEGYGLNIEPVVETDVRNSTNYTYRNAQGDFDLNSFFNPAAGETVSYRVVTDGFVQLTFNTKDYFAFATAFDLTGLNTTNGVVIRDQFRGTLRTTTGISTNLLPGMFWYNSTKKRIEVHDGTTTYDALGTRTASVSYNPPLLAAGASGPEQSTAISGVALGDHVTAAFNQNLLGLMVVAWVSAADTVNWYFHNPAGNPNGSQDLPTGNVSFRVVRP